MKNAYQRRCRVLTGLLLLASAAIADADASDAVADSDCVILLHGLARQARSMKPLAQAFAARGYSVQNVDYPSRKLPIEQLSALAVEQGLAQCPPDGEVHFATHSLGGILVRLYLANNELARLGRVVMLAPPNQGSEVVDKLRSVPGYTLVNGPAGAELGTDARSVPLNLGPVDYELGIIAGTKTFNPILSLLLPNPDDGKVSVERTKVSGMTDFITLHRTHTFMMKADDVMAQAVTFIETGIFDHDHHPGVKRP